MIFVRNVLNANMQKTQQDSLDICSGLSNIGIILK